MENPAYYVDFVGKPEDDFAPCIVLCPVD